MSYAQRNSREAGVGFGQGTSRSVIERATTELTRPVIMNKKVMIAINRSTVYN